MTRKPNRSADAGKDTRETPVDTTIFHKLRQREGLVRVVTDHVELETPEGKTFLVDLTHPIFPVHD